jgi:hypothetical protein
VITNPNFWFKEQTKEYLFSNPHEECSNCRKIVDDVIFAHYYVQLKKDHLVFYCKECIFKAKKSKVDYWSTTVAVVVEEIPIEAVMVVFRPAPLSNIGKVRSVFDVAVDNSDGAEIEDNTVHALRESYGGATVGIMPPEDKRQLDENEVLRILTAKPEVKEQITEETKKLIEERK